LKGLGNRNLTDISVANMDLFDKINKKAGNIWGNPGGYSITLTTKSNQRSAEGFPASTNSADHEPYDLTVLPMFSRTSLVSWNAGYSLADTLHEDLRQDDGSSFLIIHRAGLSSYTKPVYDPFFSAHSNSQKPPYFTPDFEATALGCLEQFQFCVSGSNFCTSWGMISEQMRATKSHLERQSNKALLDGLWLFEIFAEVLSVLEYLLVRNGGQYGVPLALLSPWQRRLFNQGGALWDAKDQWATEVETWFTKGILNAILFTQKGTRYSLPRLHKYPHGEADRYWSDERQQYYKKYLICDRILFHDSDYTNINLAGFCAMAVALLVLCTMSLAMPWIDKKMGTIPEYVRAGKYAIKGWALVAGTKFRAFVSKLSWMKKLRSWALKAKPWIRSFAIWSVSGHRKWFVRHQHNPRPQISDFADVELASAATPIES
jgi:hypothetical protein